MTFSIEQIGGLLLSLFTGLIGFVFHGFSKRIEILETKQQAHELNVANNYVKDSDLKEAIQPLFKKLDKIEEKLDKANFEISHRVT